jgi:class 3 adenylate cyclase
VAFCPNCGLSAPAASRFCPSCGAPISEQAQRSEERKLATVLFADLVGSTKLASSQDAERTRSLLNRFYDAMATEIADAGGTVEKFARALLALAEQLAKEEPSDGRKAA